MSDDQRERELCICYHVTFGKVARYIKRHKDKLRRVSQVSQCYGAGTGCGWCVPFIEKMYEDVKAGIEPEFKLSGEEYRSRRKEYHVKIGYGKNSD